jgi:perosamine synthetase
VDYAGQPCDYNALRDIAERHGLVLIADACHSIGAQFNGRNVGTLADLSVFSFHPVKHITTGEGGMVVTDETKFAEKMRRFRNHGITSDHHQRRSQGSWFYEMVDLGYNYRISDFQCALGTSQLGKLSGWIKRLNIERDDIFKELHTKGIGVNVHYIPVHLHPFYRNCFATKSGLCVAAEAAYERLISLPIFPGMTDDDIDIILSAIKVVLNN